MSNNHQKRRRQAVVEDIQAEGAEAYRQGRHSQTVPQAYIGTMNRYQWLQGYFAARDEDQANSDDHDEDESDDYDQSSDQWHPERPL